MAEEAPGNVASAAGAGLAPVEHAEMNQRVDDRKRERKPDDDSKDDGVKKRGRRIFYGSFWADHAVAIWGLCVGVSFLSSLFEFRGAPVAGFLVLLAVMVYWYAEGKRLAGTPTDEERQQADQEFKERVSREISELKLRLDDANKRLSQQNERFLSAEQRDAIIKALSPFAGQRVLIASVQEAEARRFANDVGKALGDAGWNVTLLTGLAFSIFPLNFDNVQIAIDREWYDGRPVAPAVIKVVEVFGSLGIARNDGEVSVEDLVESVHAEERETILIRVGMRPRGTPTDAMSS